MNKSEAYRAVESVVRSLGVTCANISMRQFIQGVELIHMDATLIDSVTHRLYPKIAQLYPSASGGGIERNLRSARDIIVDRGDRERLEEVIGFKLRYPPSVADLLDSVEYYMDRNGLWPDG